jgi:hypothetical protein
MVNYELLMGVSTNSLSAQAKKIMEAGWTLGNYLTIRLDQKIPWSLIDNSQRSWNFHIHCWDMLDTLLAACSLDGGSEFLKPSLCIALDWSARYGCGADDATDTPFAWYDMAVGLRAYRLAYLIDAARDAGILSVQDDTLLWNTLLAHHAYLANDANIAFHNNHGYYQVAGQMAMGRRFCDSVDCMRQALEQGQERLRIMLQQQFASDGVHREHSPDYHRMVYDTLAGLMASGLVTDPKLDELVWKVEKALAWFVLPNQRLVNFGDSDYRDVARSDQQAEQKWRTPAMRWQASAGAVGENPGGGLKRFDEGGYFIYRQPSQYYTSKTCYVAQIAAFHSRTHKHADDLSFIWFDRGEEILVDAGRFGYLGKTEQGTELWLDGHWYSDPKRIYCESTRAHNCLEFDGLNYPRRGVKPYGAALQRSLELSCGLVAMETECRHFKGNRHARLLIIMPGEWLIVFDWFHDNLAESHNVRQWFHLGEDWELTLRQSAYQAVSGKTGQVLGIVPLLLGSTASRPYIGETEPQLQGWWSPAERQLLPNFAFCYEQEAATSGSFATLFSFAEGARADFTLSRANVAGRQIRLRWRDCQASHCLDIARPAQGDLSVQYTRRSES